MPLDTTALWGSLGLDDAQTVLSTLQVLSFFRTSEMEPFEVEALLLGTLLSLSYS